MKPYISAVVFVAVLTVPACDNSTRDHAPVPINEIVLLDVQGLEGGQDLWIGEDGTAFAQIVGDQDRPGDGHGLWAKRYRLHLAPEQIAELERLVGLHDFLHVQISRRSADPDEAHPTIFVRAKSGGTVAATKSEGDSHRDFDPIYTYLLGVIHAAKEKEMIGEGEYDWHWHPDGFAPSSEIYAKARGR